MHASRLSVHSWKGADRLDDVIEHPGTPAIEAAICRLDGDRTTEICIEAEDGSYLILGGGAGRYVGFVSRNENELHNLVSPTASAEPSIELCAGGQTGYFAERQLVDLATAVRAACAFAKHGELEQTVTWEIQYL